MTSQPPPLLGLHHIKLAATDLTTTLNFYTTILPFQPLPSFNHYDKNNTLFAVLFQHPASKTLVEVRKNTGQAKAQVG